MNSSRRHGSAFIVLLTLLGLLLPSLFTTGVVQAASTITGVVFQDYNANGTRDTTTTIPNSSGTGTISAAVDSGVGSVTVTAFDAANTPFTTNTAPDGTYTLNVPTAGPYRVEFTAIPVGFEPTAQGATSNTTVQFVTGGAVAVNLGINRPVEYCQNNPDLVANCFVQGDQIGGPFNTDSVLKSFPYAAGSNRVAGGAPFPDYDNPTTHSTSLTAQTVGTTWGIAWARSTKRLYASAFFRRHAGFGPGNQGAIYVINPQTNAVVQTFTLAAATTNAHDTTNYSRDNGNTGWDAVGKTSIGSMALSDDESTLYVMSLEDRKLYALNAATGAVITSQQVPLTPPSCPATGDVRPFAVKYYRATLYVGIVCSAESTGLTTDLRAYVYTANPATLAFSAAPVFQFTFNYGRGTTGFGSANWNAWKPVFSNVSGLSFDAQTDLLSYPQPILSDIEFDSGGNLILGLRDRAGDQGGYRELSGPLTDNKFYLTAAGGDTLYACLTSPGNWQIENDARCNAQGTGPQGGTKGPGGGEYYWKDNLLTNHDEISLGGLAQVPGYPDVVSTVFDPVPLDDPSTNNSDGGVRWWSNNTGDYTKGYRFYDGRAATDDQFFGKANGLGDLIALCDSAPIEIGNRVWNDSNHNGIQDANETPLAGVTVQLYDAGGALVPGATAVTDASGNYYFSSAAGTNSGSTLYSLPIQINSNYSVRIDTTQAALTGFALTTLDANNGANSDSRDSDATLTGGSARVTFATGTAGANNHTYDFGFFKPVSVGNQVWYDTDNNGQINGAEVGVDGVVVNLFLDADGDGTLSGAEQTPVAVQTTSSGGYYLFTQTTSLAGVGTGTPLDPGKYIVGIPASNFTGVGVLAGSRSSGTSISNAGVVSEAAIAANGTTDSDADNADDGTAQTAGFYAGGVLSGQLTVTAGGEPGGATPGHNNTVDGTAGGSAIPNANINRTVDFGFYRQTLGNLVFHDVANNGIFDGADVALAGASVRLYAQNGTTEIPVGSDGILGTADDALGGVTTLAAGTYLFQNLPQGQYIVKVTPPAGYSSSSDIASSGAPNANGDNDDNGVGGGQGTATSAPITLTPGSSGPSFPNNVVSAATGTTANPTLDFGFYTLSLGNLVWNDLNNNGRVDGAETGINGVLVNLFVDSNGNGVLDAADTPAGTQSTSNGGHYLFTGLAPGQYLVQLDPTNFQGAGLLAGYRSSNGTNGALSGPFEPVAAAGTTDNDDNGTTGAGGIVSSVITVVAGGAPITEADLALPTAVTDPAVNANSNLSIDFGVFQPASLGDFVWIDTDKNGVQDVSEPGVDGVQVSLYTANGADGIPATADDALPIAITITGDDPSTPGVQLGFYRFDNLTPNTVYTIRLDRAADFTGGGPLVGYSVTKNDQGGNDALDSDATLVGGVPTISATTGAPGSYTPTYDFGFNTGAALGDYVWLDANNNGVQDPSEVGINGVTVRLYDGATLVDSTVTAPSGGTAGYYHFTSLDLNKTYTVRLDNPADYAPGSPLAGLVLAPRDAPAAGDAADSDASLVGAPIGSLTGTPSIVSAPTGGAGSDTPTYDFGFYKPIAALGDYVWFDANKNGVQDVGELGINGVTVHLYDGATLVGTTVTATSGSTPGSYRFANLDANKTYTIKLDNPADYAPGGALANTRLAPMDGGADDARDSDATLVGGFPTISAAPTGGDLSDTRTYDFGFYQPLSLGNLVWNDLNNNGIKDVSEAGVDGVAVNLYIDTDGSGTLTAGDTLAGTATTSNGGHYLFTDLGKGSYLVQIAPSNFGAGAPLAGYASSTGTYGVATGPYEPGVGGTSDNDDKGTTLNGGIVSGLINLMAGTQPTSEPDMTLPSGVSDAGTDNSSNLTVDFGVFQPARLGNVVWYDDNKDGMKAPGERGVANVTVTLYDRNGTPVATVTTDSNGAYQFVNLPPGSYTVGFTNLPKNFTFTTPNQGSDDANDSDVDLATGRTASVTLVPGQNNPTLYAGIVPQAPTAITLSHFTATQRAGGNIIAWMTSAEVNTWGFHLYRSSTSSRAAAERVTSQIILATGRGTAGTTYRWTDTTAQAGVRYSYWLQEVEVGGATNEYGPATLGVTAAPAANTAQTVRVFLPMISH